MRPLTTISILLFVLIVGACDSLVREESFDQVTTANFPSSQADVRLAVNGSYDALQSTYESFAMVHQGIMGSMQHNYTRDWISLIVTNRTADPGDSGVPLLWQQAYNVIGRTNFLLTSINESSSLEENATIEQYKAEIRFLRAYNYFNLVRLFGHIPLVTTTPENLDDAVLPDTTGTNELGGQFYDQVDRSEVYDFIVKDLKYAEQNLPESYDEANQGRVTSGAASGMLAKVYLTRAGNKWNYNSGGLKKGNPAYYDSTVIATQKVINSSHQLIENFGELFDPNTEHNTENLFSVQYVSSSQAGQTGEGTGVLQQINGIRNAPITPYSYNQVKAAIPYFNQWVAANGKDDKRFKPTFLTEYVDTDGDTVRWGNNPATFPGPALKKYLFDIDYPNISAQNGNDYGVNWVLLRFADVLLMDSEAKNKSANYTVSQALDGINKVRERAGKTTLSTSLSREALNDSIFAERKWELSYENHYYFDSQRTGRLEEEIELSISKPGTTTQRSKATFSQKYYILPLPFQALQNNPSLVQNAGW